MWGSPITEQVPKWKQKNDHGSNVVTYNAQCLADELATLKPDRGVESRATEKVVAALTTRRRCLHTQNKEYKHSPLTVALLGMLKGFKLDKSLYLP